jgi:hypothetical protein
MGEGNFTKAGLAGKAKNYTGMYEKDQEAWSFGKTGFENLLRKLSRFKKVLILSGDVHYAHTSFIKLWSSEAGKYKLTEIVQSTSSAFKNSTDKTHFPIIDLVKHVSDIPVIGKIPLVKYIPIYGDLVVSTDTPYYFIKILHKYEKYHRDLGPVKNPSFERIDRYLAGNRLLIEPDFQSDSLQYSVLHLKAKNRTTLNPQIISQFKKTKQAANFKELTDEPGIHDTVIGKDNITLISFSGNSIISRIWYANGNRNKPDAREGKRLLFPYAAHVINLNAKIILDEIPLNQMLKRANIRRPQLTFSMP